jgi:VanZ family protein
MIETRPRWAWLFFVQLSLIIAASVLATTGHFPAAVFRSPFDKVGHLGAYGGLALLAVAFYGRRRSLAVMGALLIAATLEEVSQRAFPTRTFDLGDLAMNWVGIVAGTGIARWLISRSVRARQG